MAEIAVQKAEAKKAKKREIYARVCYFYPQYKLEEVASMPNRDVVLLLKVANQVEALRMLNLTQISAAPHTKKGSGVKRLTTHFKRIAKDG
jgi:hypothetical protein